MKFKYIDILSLMVENFDPNYDLWVSINHYHVSVYYERGFTEISDSERRMDSLVTATRFTNLSKDHYYKKIYKPTNQGSLTKHEVLSYSKLISD